MTYLITKTSGEQEPFNQHKFKRSLIRAGLSEQQIVDIMREVENLTFSTTKEIHDYVLHYLHRSDPAIAARYNLKQAIMELGPEGFSFEQFVAQIFREQGYNVSTDQHMQGMCVEHEIDLVAHKDNIELIAECKFHNRLGLKTDIKVALYTNASFQDLKQAWFAKNPTNKKEYQVWVISNTQFTSQAIQYAQCTGMFLLGWSYPAHNSLPELIDQLGLHPITSLTTLNHKQKMFLISHGIVLCRDIQKARKQLEQLQFPDNKIDQIIEQAERICSLNASIRSWTNQG